MENWVIIDYIWVLVDSDAPLNIEHTFQYVVNLLNVHVLLKKIPIDFYWVFLVTKYFLNNANILPKNSLENVTITLKNI